MMIVAVFPIKVPGKFDRQYWAQEYMNQHKNCNYIYRDEINGVHWRKNTIAKAVAACTKDISTTKPYLFV